MNDEVERIQVTIAQLEAKVNKASKWIDLLDSPLFQELITKDYLGDDAVRITMNRKPGGDNDISNALLDAKSVFSRFVANTIHEGETARDAIIENQELQDEIDSEG